MKNNFKLFMLQFTTHFSEGMLEVFLEGKNGSDTIEAGSC